MTTTAAPAQKPPLRRVLTLKYLVVFGIAYLAPTVVFDYYGIITTQTRGMMSLAYLITTVAMFFTAYSYAQMVKAFPQAGSAYTYVQRSVHPWLGFFTGWVMLIDYVLLPMICYLLLGIYMHQVLPDVPVAAWVIAAAAFGAVTNIVGVRASGRVNAVIVTAQVLFCLVLTGVLIWSVVSHGGVGALVNPAGVFSPGRFHGGDVLSSASVLAVAFLGFDAVSTFAEETIEPRKTVPRAVLIICVGAGLAFSTIAYITQLAWPTAYRDINDPNAGIFELLHHIDAEALRVPFLIVDNLSTIVCAMVGLAAVSRILYGMGRDGALPRRFFGSINRRTQTPVNNILLTSGAALTAIFYADNLLGAASLMSFGAITGFFFVNYSAISHYFIREKRRSGADVVKYLVVPALGMAVCAVLWIGIDAPAKILGAVWIGIGIIYIGIRTRGFRRLPAAVNLDEVEGRPVLEQVPEGEDSDRHTTTLAGSDPAAGR